jgi:hypothetical protein
MDYFKQTYHYRKYSPEMQGAKLKIIPGMQYINAHKPRTTQFYTTPSAMAQTFITYAQRQPENTQFQNFFQQKVESSQDKISLILGELNGRDTLKQDNISRIYQDLLRVDNWRIQRPYPESYLKDRTWHDLNKLELELREQIRKELKDSAKDTNFPQKDLRESLLEFKLQNQKSQMLDMSDLENEIKGGGIEPDGSNQYKGDIHPDQPTQQNPEQ